MSLLFSDGLDSGITKYSRTIGTVTWNPTGGVYGEGCIEMPAGAQNANYIDILPYPLNHADASNPIIRLSFWMKIDASITTNSGFLVFSNNAGLGGIWAYVTVDTDGRIGFYQMSTNSTSPTGFLYRPATYPRIDDNVWHHIELALKWTNSTNASYFELSVDGTLILNSSASDGVSGAGVGDPTLVNYVSFRNMRSGTVFYDDIMIWNQYNTGDNFYAKLGPTRIFTLRPESDNVVSSTASSGTDRFAMINEPSLNTANYVTLSANTADIYNLTNTANVRGQVIGVQATLYFSSNAVGYQTNVRPFLVSNGVRSNGNIATSVTTTSVELNYRFNKNFGAANAAWTASSINSLQAGFENIG